MYQWKQDSLVPKLCGLGTRREAGYNTGYLLSIFMKRVICDCTMFASLIPMFASLIPMFASLIPMFAILIPMFVSFPYQTHL